MKNLITDRIKKLLEWDKILDVLNSGCSTDKGKTIVKSLNILPENIVRTRLKQISELKELNIDGNKPDFSGVSDIYPFLNIVDKEGILQITELRQVKDFIAASDRIITFLKINKNKLEYILNDFGDLNSFGNLRDLLDSSITEKDELNYNKYKELKNITDKIDNTKNEIEAKLNRIIHSNEKSQAIQEKILSIRNDRYVILVKADMKGAVKGTMHDISSSGATLYIEPAEISHLNSRLINLQNDLKIIIFRILKALSHEIKQHSENLRYNIEKLGVLDFLTSAAKFSILIKSNEPVITDQKIIDLHKARHPVLCLMNPESVVPNDVYLGERHKCIIISGANTGGKTVLLKTIGLCALMIMHGLHIPAGPDSRIGIFSDILADIGDDQNIEQSLSTYSGQIVIINEMLASAKEGVLVLIDELLVGTNPRQGSALARAVLEAFIETEALIIMTTHYSELKELPVNDERFQNASVSFDIETLKPTYKLIQGLPGASYAIEIARNYGLEEKIIQRANELLDSSELSSEALIESIRQQKVSIEEEFFKIEKIKQEIIDEKAELSEKKRKLDNRAAELKSERGMEFLEELKKHKEELTKRIKSIRKDSLAENEALNRDVSSIQENISEVLKKDRIDKFSSSYKPLSSLNPGDLVFIISLEKTGTVESVDSINKNAVIILGPSIKARYNFNDILIPENYQNETKKRKDTESRPESLPERIPLTIQTPHNTSDLRGMRVEAAIAKLEKDLDTMIRNNIYTAVVIHGHGTGALKNAVREWLKFSFYVKEFRPGEQNEGGDGVSVVQLKG